MRRRSVRQRRRRGGRGATSREPRRLGRGSRGRVGRRRVDVESQRPSDATSSHLVPPARPISLSSLGVRWWREPTGRPSVSTTGAGPPFSPPPPLHCSARPPARALRCQSLLGPGRSKPSLASEPRRPPCSPLSSWSGSRERGAAERARDGGRKGRTGWTKGEEGPRQRGRASSGEQPLPRPSLDDQRPQISPSSGRRRLASDASLDACSSGQRAGMAGSDSRLEVALVERVAASATSRRCWARRRRRGAAFLDPGAACCWQDAPSRRCASVSACDVGPAQGVASAGQRQQPGLLDVGVAAARLLFQELALEGWPPGARLFAMPAAPRTPAPMPSASACREGRQRARRPVERVEGMVAVSGGSPQHRTCPSSLARAPPRYDGCGFPPTRGLAYDSRGRHSSDCPLALFAARARKTTIQAAVS